jgi:hypothetical protein
MKTIRRFRRLTQRGKEAGGCYALSLLGEMPRISVHGTALPSWALPESQG